MFLFLGPSISSGGDNHRVTVLQGFHEFTFEGFYKQCQVHNLAFVSTEYKIFKSILAFHVFGNKPSWFFNIPSFYIDFTLTAFLLKEFIMRKKKTLGFSLIFTVSKFILICKNPWFAPILLYYLRLTILTTQMSHQPLRKWHAFATSFFPSLLSS